MEDLRRTSTGWIIIPITPIRFLLAINFDRLTILTLDNNLLLLLRSLLRSFGSTGHVESNF